MSRRTIRVSARRLALHLAVPFALLLGLSGLPAVTDAQACNPRPRVTVETNSAGPGRLSVTVKAGVGAIQWVQFPSPTGTVSTAPYTVEIGGQSRTPPFTFTPQGGPTSLSFVVVRQAQVGATITTRFVVRDGCGDWPTFVGGGPTAWEVPVRGRVLNAADAQPIAGATVQVQGTSLQTTTDGSGGFTIQNVPRGAQSLRTSAGGFLTDTRSVEIVSERDLPRQIPLHKPATASLPTSTGTNVIVAPEPTEDSGVQGVTVTFSGVSSAGTTTVARIEPPTRAAPPPDGPVVGGAYFGLSSTAQTSGDVEVELPFDPTALGGGDLSQLRLLRLEGTT